MGFSDPTNKPWTQTKIIEINPKTVLDVGAGQGVYLDLIRSGLGDSVEVHAVEVWQPYIDQFNLENRYNRLYAMDIREMKNFDYDLVILGDVLEHMPETEAIELWSKISKQARRAIISIPIIHYHQDAINGNPYEVHVEEDWDTKRVLSKFKDIVEYKEFPVTGVFIAEFTKSLIPNKIWQTYKDEYNTLPEYAIEASNTWKNINPNYDYEYMSDAQAKTFIKEKFGQNWLDIFNGLPVGVMRGDLWRYMVIYEYGGIYADLDTRCIKPIDSWLLKDKEMIVCPENDRDFCQWTFAATPKHPILKSVLDYIYMVLSSPKYGEQHFVHNHTGPVAWTFGIMNALQLNNVNLIDDFEKVNNSDKAKEYKFYLYGGEQWRIFHFQSVEHIYGSQKWNDGRYVQWIEDPLVRGTR